MHCSAFTLDHSQTVGEAHRTSCFAEPGAGLAVKSFLTVEKESEPGSELPNHRIFRLGMTSDQAVEEGQSFCPRRKSDFRCGR
jgi:hypothetical protein